MDAEMKKIEDQIRELEKKKREIENKIRVEEKIFMEKAPRDVELRCQLAKMNQHRTCSPVYYRGEKVTTFVYVEGRAGPAQIAHMKECRERFGVWTELTEQFRGMTYAVVDGKIVGGMGGGSVWVQLIIDWSPENEYERVAAIAKRRIEMIEAWLATNPKEDDVLTWIDV